MNFYIIISDGLYVFVLLDLVMYYMPLYQVLLCFTYSFIFNFRSQVV